MREKLKLGQNFQEEFLLREWPSKTKQWINSGSKCYGLELRDGSDRAGGEAQLCVLPGPGQDQPLGQPSVCASISDLGGTIPLLGAGAQ